GLQLVTAQEGSVFAREVSARLTAYDAPHKEMLMTFSTDWLDDEVVERASRTQDLWCAAEVWRALGRRSEQYGRADDAQTFYLRAIETAKQQGAKGWELRAAGSLAQVRRPRAH